MNVTALIISAIGAAIIFSGFFFARSIQSKLKANLVRVVAGVGGFLFIPITQTLLNLPFASTTKSGEYFFYLIVAGAVISKLFGKKSKKSEEDTT